MENRLTGPASPDAVLRLAEQVADADDVAAVGEANLLAVRHGTSGYRHHWVTEGQELVGYAVLDPGASAELCVHPAHRRAGRGRQLLDAVLAEEPQAALWAHGDLPGAQALARSAGLRVTRELWQMARELSATTQPSAPGAGGSAAAPDGVGTRSFAVGQDEEAWVALNAAAFADHPEQGRLTVADLRERQAEPWFDPTLLWLAHEAGHPGELLASMWVKVEPGERTGEIYALGVGPTAQGRGLGRWLTTVALDEMQRRGLERVNLYVEGDNTPAIRTYRRAGFDRSALDVQYAR